MTALAQTNLKRAVATDLKGRHVLHRPPARGRIGRITQPLEATDDIRRRQEHRVPRRETKRVDQAVRRDHRQLAESRDKTIGPRLVIDLQRRLVDQLDRMAVVDGLRQQRIHRNHPLQRPRKRCGQQQARDRRHE